MLLRVSLLALCALCANLSQGAPTTGDVDYMAYLTRYKYLRANNPDPRIASLTDSLKEAIKSFQHMAGVPITGVMDKATRYAMFLPRCGVPDVLNMGGVARKRKRRFVTQGSRWSSNHLTYKISKYTSDMSKDVVDAEIRRALNVWASVTPLTFTQKDSGKVDIEIKFVRGEHGDGNPFDGPRGTLAHAFFPQYGGDAHFDEDEAWVFRTGKTGSINLFQVAAHEFGHSLGLAHTDVNTALMAPLYRGYEPNFTLDPDDISGIQRIYGSKTKTSPAAPTKRITTTTSSTTTTTTTPTTTTTTQSTTKPIQRHTTRHSTTSTARVTQRRSTRLQEVSTTTTVAPTTTITVAKTTRASGTMQYLCADGRMDAITQADDDKIYAFRGSVYTKIDDDGIADGFPRAIADDWPGLPSDIDAALTWPSTYTYLLINGRWVRKSKVARVYFFKGDKYWRYEQKQLKAGYPKLISKGFTGVPDNIDAAFVWSGNGKTYFIKDDKYYRYTRSSGIDNGYPRDLRVWKGLPSTISAAFQWRRVDRTYFYNGVNYYRFNDRLFKADSSYPRPLATWWYGCAKAPSANSLVAPREMESAPNNNNQFVGVSVANAATTTTLAIDATATMDTDATTANGNATTNDTTDISSATVMSSLSLGVCIVLATFVTSMTGC